jgi:hypothetical protein
MAKSQLPNALDLRILALYIERDMLSLDQKVYVVKPFWTNHLLV